MPTPRTTRPMRKAKFVVNPEESDTADEADSDGGSQAQKDKEDGGDSDATIEYEYDSEATVEYDLDEEGSVKCEPEVAPVTSVRIEKIRRGRVLLDRWQEQKHC